MTHDLRAHVEASRRPSKYTEPHIRMPSNEHKASTCILEETAERMAWKTRVMITSHSFRASGRHCGDASCILFHSQLTISLIGNILCVFFPMSGILVAWMISNGLLI